MEVVGDIMAWLQPFAAVFDLILQTSLLIQIRDHTAVDNIPQLAIACAVLHTIILGLGALYILVVIILICAKGKCTRPDDMREFDD